MNPIEFNYKKLKIAQDLPKKTLESIGMKLMKKNSNGIFEIPKDEVIVSYINDLASKRKIKQGFNKNNKINFKIWLLYLL